MNYKEYLIVTCVGLITEKHKEYKKMEERVTFMRRNADAVVEQLQNRYGYAPAPRKPKIFLNPFSQKSNVVRTVDGKLYKR